MVKDFSQAYTRFTLQDTLPGIESEEAIEPRVTDYSALSV
jgi:hypothetical protein